ncbi:MAG: DUF1616 domain-containing protein [Chloroflexota bacterium]|nr:DUF1616 domain-containing protein [Chloroflexota bacterium]
MLDGRNHLDLILIDIAALALALVVFALPVPALRPVLGFPFVMFSPGYVLVAMLYPGKESLSPAARITLSLGLSIVGVVFIGLALNYTPWGIRLHPLVIAVTLFILAVSVAAWYRRRQTNFRQDFNIRAALTNWRHQWTTSGRLCRSLIMVLLGAILLGGSALGYAMAKSPVNDAFTEFYILGTGGKADNYPRQLRPGEEGRVIIGIVSHELAETTYRLEVAMAGVKLSELAPPSLKPGETWQAVIVFTPQQTSDNQKVEFILYKGKDNPGEVRYLWVNVRI